MVYYCSYVQKDITAAQIIFQWLPKHTKGLLRYSEIMQHLRNHFKLFVSTEVDMCTPTGMNPKW